MKAQRTLWWIARAGWVLGYGIVLSMWGVHREWLWAALAAIFGLLSIANSYGRRAWLVSVYFLVLLALGGVATLWSSGAALGSVLCGLIAWDVELFARRLAPYTDVPEALVRAHLMRLGAIVLLSGALGTAALSLTMSLSFGVILLLAFGFLVMFLLLLRQGLRG
uniref:Uncharacterized protein n=1 Tax=Acetithermum autotrophicum TaxID=1446466 RepID=H5SVS6_ACEAU|nr:hypothetical protein HGMM_OP4C345 [Candidatus Acetothermum autotrophicum]